MKAILFFIILVSLLGFFVASSAMQVLFGVFAFAVCITCAVIYGLEEDRLRNYRNKRFTKQ